MSVTVIEFITLDGIVSDPDGSAGTLLGGWAFRYGPEAVAGDTSSDSAALWTTGSCCSGARPGSSSRGCGPDATTRSPSA
ncbi:hypothetical protein [Streptomyces sp. NPDC059994]|uniref:hypothetical protein n=1 Tax=Streptomyces sp. NPDC059994 TaxID=3347029 RepID=UPI0036A1EF7A